MPFTHTITRGLSRPGSEPSSQQAAVTGGLENNLSESIPDESADLAVGWNVDQSEIQSLYISSDQDVTIKTNSDSVPDDTFALKANQPIAWAVDDVGACPITADVTAGLFVTNASGAPAALEIYCLVDPTPA